MLSVIVHVLILIWFQFGPNLHLFQASPEELEARRQELLRQQEKERDDRRFVFVQPRVDLEALKPKPRADLSDLDRQAQARERAVKPENPLAVRARELVGARRSHTAGAGEGARDTGQARPDAAATRASGADRTGAPACRHRRETGADDVETRAGRVGRCVAESRALRAERDVQQPARGAERSRGDDSVRHEGRRVRAVAAPIRRPGAAQLVRAVRGDDVSRPRRAAVQHPQGRAHHRHFGRRPSDINAFNLAANNAILGSNPTEPLPPEYPDPKAFFTVTFYYNESPPVN